jgi:hypothetical protein
MISIIEGSYFKNQSVIDETSTIRVELQEIDY